jgi:hypothetical protein
LPPRAAHRLPAAHPRRQGQTPPKVGAQGPSSMGSVPAEACHQVPRPLRALRAGRPPKAALEGQRGGIHRQLGYEVPAQPSQRTLRLNSLRSGGLQFWQTSSRKAASPGRARMCRTGVGAGRLWSRPFRLYSVVDQTRHKSQSDLCLVSWTNRSESGIIVGASAVRNRVEHNPKLPRRPPAVKNSHNALEAPGNCCPEGGVGRLRGRWPREPAPECGKRPQRRGRRQASPRGSGVLLDPFCP